MGTEPSSGRQASRRDEDGAAQAPPGGGADAGPSAETSWSDLGWDDEAWTSERPSDEQDGADERGWWGSGGSSNEGVDLLQAAARDAIVAARSLLDVAEELLDDPAALGAAVTSLRSAAGGFLRGAAGREPHPGEYGSPSADPEGYEHIDLD